MSSEIAIRVENLSKCYQIYDQPRDRLKQFILPHLQGVVGRQPKKYFREFWALRDISFEIKKGETVGIIGRNGSGKSTLLQMICGTLNPTGGSIQTHGRIAALLELGSGFNPEFTGRENVYMNAAVLGLSKADIDARFDQITDFADIGEFIEQPTKTYSSGMMIRLAFAVIAHVDADILVIDEALAVGDAVFTQKCMRFIRQFKERGSIIFVSHDMSSVLSLCQRAVWLHYGAVREIGESKEIAAAYLQYTLQEMYGQEVELKNIDTAESAVKDQNIIKTLKPKNESHKRPFIDYDSQMRISNNLNESNGWRTGAAEIIAVRMEQLDHQSSDVFHGGETVRLVITAKANQQLDKPILGFIVRDRLGQDLFGENTLSFTTLNPSPIEIGAAFESEFVFRLPMLPNGQYAVTVSVAEGELDTNVQHQLLHDALILNVFSSRVRWGLVGVQFEKIVLMVNQ